MGSRLERTVQLSMQRFCFLDLGGPTTGLSSAGPFPPNSLPMIGWLCRLSYSGCLGGGSELSHYRPERGKADSLAMAHP